MRSAGQFVSRRSVLWGSGAAVGATLLPLPPAAQPAAFRAITARTGTVNLRGGDTPGQHRYADLKELPPDQRCAQGVAKSFE